MKGFVVIFLLVIVVIIVLLIFMLSGWSNGTISDVSSQESNYTATALGGNNENTGTTVKAGCFFDSTDAPQGTTNCDCNGTYSPTCQLTSCGFNCQCYSFSPNGQPNPARIGTVAISAPVDYPLILHLDSSISTQVGYLEPTPRLK